MLYQFKVSDLTKKIHVAMDRDDRELYATPHRIILQGQLQIATRPRFSSMVSTLSILVL